MATDKVTIGLLYPELLGTYGDGGNARVLAQRLSWRGLSAETAEVAGGDPIPESCDIYVLGGGEDGPQALAARDLSASRSLERAVSSGAAVLAVCAGYQLIGHQFVGPDGTLHPGLGLLDCSTARGRGPRRVGEVVVEPDAGMGLPPLTGYENHAGVTLIGASARPLGRVRTGSGNGDGTEGAVAGRVMGTYLHGPVLARNPALADLLLSWVVGDLPPVDDTEVEALRTERIDEAARHRSHRRGWRLGRP